LQRLPDMFTAFRHAVEKAGVLPASPLPLPAAIPPLPESLELSTLSATLPQHDSQQPIPGLGLPAMAADPRSSFPYRTPAYAGGTSAAAAHVASYFERKLAHTYKATRNGLSGTDYSSKFSPWLASGALSARSIYQSLKQFETQHGANDGSYWLWFELLWRDYFRFLHCQRGVTLYRAQGLANATLDPTLAAPPHHAASFRRWCLGETGEAMVDAGMHELAATGYLSNRLRQIVASYLIHDLACDWRAGAAWFEAQLIDFDVYSNQGNWLYIAGRGTDPRGGRRFNPQKQAHDYDPDGHYRALWRHA
jgi:deoxyribodipyrimidine photo-lyase